MSNLRSRFEFHVTLDDARDFADMAAADYTRFVPMAKRYRNAMLRRSLLIAPILVFAGIGATSVWQAAIAAGPVGAYLGAALGLSVAAVYVGSAAPLEQYVQRLQREYRDSCFVAWLFTLVGHWTAEIQQDGVEFRSQHDITKSLWPSIHDIRLTEDGIRLDSMAMGGALIPMRAFAGMAEAESVAERLRELCSQHPAFAHREIGRFLAEQSVRCGYCGYSLAGCEQPQCPECGESVAGSILVHSFRAPSLGPQSMDSAGL